MSGVCAYLVCGVKCAPHMGLVRVSVAWAVKRFICWL